jgi:hypothetical protein
MLHILTRLCAVIATLLLTIAPGSAAEPVFKRIPTQYIAALGPESATKGTNAEAWGLWVIDPGPRGVRLTQSSELLATKTAPAGWTLDMQDWWIEEFGRIMEKPDFPMPPGKYVVTNGKSSLSILTVHAKGASGHMTWDLSHGATLIGVTHLGCRAGRYRPETAGAICTPGNASPAPYPIAPGAKMPEVPGCTKQDYHVLIVVGLVEGET